jgi:hypothetical protein
LYRKSGCIADQAEQENKMEDMARVQWSHS